MQNIIRNKTILTGDRPTGPLHIGHLAGSLLNRVRLQEHNEQTVLIANTQALTDNIRRPDKVRENVTQLMLDYLAVGLDPDKTRFVLQSGVPELYELTAIYMNLVNMGRLTRNPTIRNEIEQRGFGGNVPVGFLCYPISQAADITAFNADLVPAGKDQSPLIQQCNDIVRTVNDIAKAPVLRTADILTSDTPSLIGTDGLGKMSKSAGNAIFLSDGPDEIRRKVMGAFTDPEHIRISDRGNTKDNPVFQMLSAFDEDVDGLGELRDRYEEGGERGVGDVFMKRRLNDVLQEVIGPIRSRREAFAEDIGEIMHIMRCGTENGRSKAIKTVEKLRKLFF